MDDDAIVERLTAVRGIGRWTVEMLLIFRLGRPDVLPADDYGIRKGFAVAFRKRELPDRAGPRKARRELEAVPDGRELVPLARRRARQRRARIGRRCRPRHSCRCSTQSAHANEARVKATNAAPSSAISPGWPAPIVA